VAARFTPATVAIDRERGERRLAEILVQETGDTGPHDVDRARDGEAATGVPHAIASSITSPKVSVRLGDTNTSADDNVSASCVPKR
jgi:hypothetical protein